jgi:arsenate reductase
VKVLFVCTHNSARSQMAEALLRSLYGDRHEAQSAGTEATRVHPLALEAMREVGIDIARQRSKSIGELAGARFDLAVTVCDDAREACPVVPGAARQLHWSLPDPSRAKGDETERLAAFRSVRDELRRLIEETFGGG